MELSNTPVAAGVLFLTTTYRNLRKGVKEKTN